MLRATPSGAPRHLKIIGFTRAKRIILIFAWIVIEGVATTLLEAPGASQSAPGAPPGGARRHLEGSSDLHNTPKKIQNRPKRAPRAPKRRPERSHFFLACALDAALTGTRARWMPWALWATILDDFGTIFGRFGADFWSIFH